jgi:ferredoxin
LEIKTIDLVCALHEDANTGSISDSIGIRVRGCLAGLGTGTFLMLAATGLERIVLRLDACEDCPWASLQGTIQTQVDQASQLLARWGMNESLVCWNKLDERVERPLWDADNPPLSRRDLFRMASRQGQIAMARAMDVDSSESKRRPGRDRLRLIGAVAHLPEPKAFLADPIEKGHFAKLSVSEECNACKVCVRACPTGALEFKYNHERTYYWLHFHPQVCVGCEICAHVCAPDAIEIEKKPPFAQVFGKFGSRVVSEGELKQCVQCKTLFASQDDKSLCPVCMYRRKIPFGSMMPPGVKAIKRSIDQNTHDF